MKRHVKTLRPGRAWIDLCVVDPTWASFWPAPVRGSLDLLAELIAAAQADNLECPITDALGSFLKRMLVHLSALPDFGRVDDGQAEVVDVVFRAGEGDPIIRLGLRRDQDDCIYVASRADWTLPTEATPCAEESESVLMLAKHAYEALVRFSGAAPARREGLLLVSVKEFFDDLNLSLCKPGPCEDGYAWRSAQLRHAWESVGASLQPRIFLKAAARFFAEQNGAALLRLAREAEWYLPTRAGFQAACYLGLQSGYLRRDSAGQWVAVVTNTIEALESKIVKVAALPSARKSHPHMHRAQRQAYERCVALGTLHFSKRLETLSLRPRTFPLLVGPSGVGKSFLAAQVAKALDAHLLPLTFGRWFPAGARDSRQTMFVILDALSEHQRLAVFLDELDKCSGWDGSWSRSVANDIWAALDGVFPLDAYRVDREDAKTVKPADLARLWIIGAGTWQNQTEPTSERRSIGFAPAAGRACESSSADVIARVRAAREVPVELLARFHSEPIHLGYPSPDEVPTLLRRYGVVELAAEAGVDIADIKLDFGHGGVRVLEAIVADLLLKIEERKTPREIENYE